MCALIFGFTAVIGIGTGGRATETDGIQMMKLADETENEMRIESESELVNESEKESIKRYSQGEALFVCGNRRMRINVCVTQEELDSFGIGGGF